MSAFHKLTTSEWLSKLQLRSATTLPVIRNLADFITYLRVALVTHSQLVIQRYASFHASPPACLQSLVLLLDDIDVAERLEVGLSEKLLQLNSMIDMKLLKVICIRRTLPSDHQCMLLHFAPYSDKQLIRIACHSSNRYDNMVSKVELLASTLVPEITLTTRHVANVQSALLMIGKYATSQPVDMYRLYQQLPLPEIIPVSTAAPPSVDAVRKAISALPISTDTCNIHFYTK